MAFSPFLGTITMFAGNFAPQGWAFCNGQLLPINQNSALFALIGTTYGGDGQTTFALPNLQGRMPLGYGNGAGLSAYNIGQTGGTTEVTLTSQQLPGHTHSAQGSTSPGNAASPGPNVVLKTVGGRSGVIYNAAPSAMSAMTGLTSTGSSQPHNNQQPYLAITSIIALEGIFPSQN